MTEITSWLRASDLSIVKIYFPQENLSELRIWWCMAPRFGQPRSTSGVWALRKSKLESFLPFVLLLRAMDLTTCGYCWSMTQTHFWPSTTLGLRALSHFITSGIGPSKPLTLQHLGTFLISKLPKLIFPNTWIGCHQSPSRSMTHAHFEPLEFGPSSLCYTSRDFELLNVGEPLIQIAHGISPAERLQFPVVFTSSPKWTVKKDVLCPLGRGLCEQGPRQFGCGLGKWRDQWLQQMDMSVLLWGK